MKQFCFNKGDDFLLDNNDIIIKLKNSIYGLAIGDALGVPVEFKLRNTMDKKPVNEMRGFGTYLQPRGTWSDDTSMTLATLDALSQSKYDIRKVSANYLKWMLTGKFTINRFVFDIGNTTRKSLLKCIVTFNRKPASCGSTAENSLGNGSLMRMIPVAFYLLDEEYFEKRKQIIYDISGITHGHIVCKVTCHFYVEFAIKLIKDMPLDIAYEKTRIELKRYYKYTLPEQYYHLFRRIFNGSIIHVSRDEIESNGYVVHTLEASLWCLLNSENYVSSVLTAVNLGRDTDTTACVTGGIAGIIYPDDIPAIWLDQLRGKHIINKAISKYIKNICTK